MLSAAQLETREDFAVFLERDLNKELLRFTTAGSVDDGKSTLIGRLLHDSKSVYEDQLASVKKSRINRSGRTIDFSLLTDGLRAEREQGITIDVAYRYFSTAHRKFIIADTPGHEQYTRNMATGASTADLAILLVDPTKGLLPQTRRHAYIASLLAIPNVVAAINKMDLVGFNEGVFEKLQRDFLELAASLGIASVQCIPISALDGDNVVARSAHTPWYAGPSLLEYLETVEIRPAHDSNEFRFPVQSVIRPDASFRGFAGRIAGGTIRPGDSVLALPSRRQSKVRAIVTYDGDLPVAIPGQSVVLQLEDEIDLSRGDLLVSPDSVPAVADRFAAAVVWLHANPLEPNRPYLIKHSGRLVNAQAKAIRYRVNVNTFAEQPAGRLEMNEIGLVDFEASSPLFFDPYSRNRATGSLILIDPLSNATVGAAMIREKIAAGNSQQLFLVEDHPRGRVTEKERSSRNGHLSAIFSVPVESNLAERIERTFFERGFESLLVRGGEVPASALPAILSALTSAGLIVIFEGPVSPEARAALQPEARFFEFQQSHSADREGLLRQAATSAETLRTLADFSGVNGFSDPKDLDDND